MTFPPAGSCDCHVHVIGPRAQFPLSEPRAYTPMDAPLQALTATMHKLAIERVVLIQTSIFNTDNRCVIDGLSQLGPARARAVVVPNAATAASELDHWHTLGVRGVRLNMTTTGTPTPAVIREKIAEMVPVCARHGWHLQLFLPAALIAQISDDLVSLPVPCVIDHFGLLAPGRTPQPLQHAMLKLLESGNVWIKLSASYRIVPSPRDAGMAKLARSLHATNPERTLWASDWPHTPLHKPPAANSDGSAAMHWQQELPYRAIDTADLLLDLARWFPDTSDQARILVDNPARLYGFDN